MAYLNGYIFYPNYYRNNLKLKKIKTNKPLSYYVYEMPKVTILWNGILQPLGMFKSAEIAANELKRIGAHLPDYSLNCDGTVLKLSEYL